MGIFSKFSEAMKDFAAGAHGFATGLLDGTTKGNSIGSLIGIVAGVGVGLATGGLIPAIALGVGLGAACGIAGGAIIGSINGAVKNGHSLAETGAPSPEVASAASLEGITPTLAPEIPMQQVSAPQAASPTSFQNRLAQEDRGASMAR